MPRKKVPFVDKKAASSYVVVHRSQQDPSYYNPDASRYVLQAANVATLERDNKAREAGAVAVGELNGRGADGSAKPLQPHLAAGPAGVKELREVDDFGNPLDGYDYSQHYREITGTGTYVSADGKVRRREGSATVGAAGSGGAAMRAGGAQADLFTLPEDVAPGAEVDRHLSAITTRTDTMPEDMRELLDGEDIFDAEEVGDDGWGDLQDDFVKEAMVEAPHDPDAFDFEKHFAMLLAKAEEGGHKHQKKVFSEDEEEFLTDEEDEAAAGSAPVAPADGGVAGEDVEGGVDGGVGFSEDVSGAQQLDDKVGAMPDFDSDDRFSVTESMMSEARIRRAAEHAEQARARETRFIDEHLEAVLRHYDDDQIGELDEDVAGGGEQASRVTDMLDAAIDQYYEKQKRITADELFAKPADDDGRHAKAAEEHDEEDEVRPNGPANEQPKKKGKDRLVKIDQGPVIGRRGGFDAETIASTWTNTENHPKLLDEGFSGKKIKLSAKTGMPIVDLSRGRPTAPIEETSEAEDGSGSEADDAGSHASGVRVSPITVPGPVRKKGESADEKRARKKAVKAERRAKREAKKELKEAFRTERKRQAKAAGGKRLGQSVFQLV